MYVWLGNNKEGSPDISFVPSRTLYIRERERYSGLCLSFLRIWAPSLPFNDKVPNPSPVIVWKVKEVPGYNTYLTWVTLWVCSMRLALWILLGLSKVGFVLDNINVQLQSSYAWFTFNIFLSKSNWLVFWINSLCLTMGLQKRMNSLFIYITIIDYMDTIART